MNGSAKKFPSGFTLIEIIVALALLALVSALVIPRIRRQPLPLSKRFEQQLNGLVQHAKINAMETQKLHRIMFDLKNHTAFVEVAEDTKDSQGKNKFKKLEIPYTKTSFPLDEDLTIEKFIVNGKNLMLKTTDLDYTGMWFYITPDGLSQAVEMVIYDPEAKKNFTITINPFFGKAELT